MVGGGGGDTGFLNKLGLQPMFEDMKCDMDKSYCIFKYVKYIL